MENKLQLGLILICFCLNGITETNAQTFGTAVGDNVPMYGTINDLANQEDLREQTISYRIVDVNNTIYVKYVASAELVDVVDNYPAAWTAQLRDWGQDGNNKYEMNLAQRSEDNLIAWNKISDNQPGYYQFREGEQKVKMQVFAAFSPHDAENYLISTLFDYTKGIINNPKTGDITPPEMGNISVSESEATYSIAFSATADDDFFYYVYDKENGIEQVCFFPEFSLPKTQSGVTYNISVMAVDYNGNQSTVKTVKVEMPFDNTQNIAAGRPSYASSGTPSMGNDVNDNTRWESKSGDDDEWWYVDLGEAFDLNRIEIKWEAAYAKQFEIQAATRTLADPASDEGWTTIYHGDRELTSFPYDEKLMVDAAARYVRFKGIKRATDYGYSFWEFRVFALGKHIDVDNPVLTSVHIDNVEVVAGEEALISTVAYNQAGGKFEGATIQVTINPTSAAEILNKDGLLYVKGLTPGSYTLTAIAIDGDVQVSSTAMLTVKEARKVNSIEISSESVAAVVGRPVILTVTMKDQYGADFVPVEPLEWVVSSGSIQENKYVAIEKGAATIIAKNGAVESNMVKIEVVAEGENLALKKPVSCSGEYEDGSSPVTSAVDGNAATRWVCPAVDPTNRDYEAWITVDLGDVYDIDLVEILWEGACAEDYTVSYSLDNVDFGEPVYSKTGVEGMATVLHQFYGIKNKARYVKVHSTKAATQYGVSIWELQVFGAISPSTGLTGVHGSSVNIYALRNAVSVNNYKGDVIIYLLNGSVVQKVTVDGNQLIPLAAGMYIVSAGDISKVVIIK